MTLSARQLAQRDAKNIMNFPEAETLTRADGTTFRGKIAELQVEFVGAETNAPLTETHLYTAIDLPLTAPNNRFTDPVGVHWEITRRLQNSGIRDYLIAVVVPPAE